MSKRLPSQWNCRFHVKSLLDEKKIENLVSFSSIFSLEGTLLVYSARKHARSLLLLFRSWLKCVFVFIQTLYVIAKLILNFLWFFVRHLS